MTFNPTSPDRFRTRLAAWLDRLLFAVSVYALPLLIGVVTLAALLLWGGKLQVSPPALLDFSSIEQRQAEMTPAQAREALRGVVPARDRETRMSERPFWFTFPVKADADAALAIELPSRHASSVACWDAHNLRTLGSADRTASSGQLSAVKAGFVLDAGGAEKPAAVLCRGEFVGPAHISVAEWTRPALEVSEQEFYRRSGLLDGGLIVLAIFVLMTAVINRELVYVLFAALLVFNLRMGAISSGWDTQWLGQAVPPEWLSLSRLLTFAGFYTVTGMLFRQVFHDDLARFGYTGAMRWVHAVCLLLLPVALFAPYSLGLPVMWVAGAGSILVLGFFLFRIIAQTRSKVAVWYAASLVVTLFATFYEVIAAAFGVRELSSSVNSVTAALSSSLMAAFAIAEQIRIERQQRMQAEAELRVTYDVVPVGLFTLDARGVFVSANPALLAMLGVSESGLRQARWSTFFEDGAWMRLQNLLAPESSGEIEISGAAPGLDAVPGSGEASVTAPERKRFLVKAALAGDRIEGSLQDVTEKAKAVERLHFLAENDSLTGVLNRRGVEHRLDEALAAIGTGDALSVAYLDLDRFKLVNDLYGHAAGDAVLRQVCARAREMLTAGQSIGRIGGDEFVILFRGTSIRSAAWTCRGILDRLAATPYQVGEQAFQVRGSIGIVEVEAGATVSDVISTADQGCRVAKRGGQDGLVVYERSADIFHQREVDLHLIERLSDPRGPQGLFLVMQPLLSVRHPHEALDFEVLLRMRDADGTLIPADRLIPLAEDKGLIGIIDRWVLNSVLDWLNENGDRLTHTRFVCMNLSGASLNDEHFVDDAFALLGRFPRAAQRLCLEITESVALHDLDNMRRFIDSARAAGCKVALDDFGAGYTSFSYLKELPADVLKIDGTFIRAVNTHPSNLAIVEAIVSLARSLGMRTIAEWAEDSDTVETLVEAGIDYIQGYVVARPQQPEAILAATSSASFIQDERLRQYVRGLADGAENASLWDLVLPGKPGDLH